MNVAYEKLVEHLDQREINYVANSDSQSVSTDVVGEIADYKIVVHVPDETDLFQLVGYSPVRVPPGARSSIVEVIARANHHLRIGKLTLDFHTGELKFQIGQILTNVGLDAETVDWMICTTMAVLDKYLPAILSVIYGNEAPEEAVRRVEAGYSGDEAVG